MQPLEHGSDLDEIFDTANGSVQVLAEIYFDGSTLVVAGLAIYPTDADYMQLGIRELLKIARTFEEQARSQGFDCVQYVAKRLSGAAPGRNILLERRLV